MIGNKIREKLGLKEIDYDLPLTEDKKIQLRKGAKPREISAGTIMKQKTKGVRLKLDLKNFTLKCKCGVIGSFTF